MALAAAIMRFCGFPGLFKDFVLDETTEGMQFLEINEAGDLTPFLRQMPGHVLTHYPEVDMTRLPFGPESFDIVVHSDTLEHVPNAVEGLMECRRVLREGGACAFTVPMVLGRLTRSRSGLAASYHGSEADPAYLVHWEYGADFWTQVMEAGFTECRIMSLEYPAAQAAVCSGSATLGHAGRHVLEEA